MSIKQKLSFPATAEKLYQTLTSSQQFSEATGAPANISDSVGGAFECFGGQITGRHLDLAPNSRIVQAWRASPWDEGVYSIVKFEISESNAEATLELEHHGYPASFETHLDSGWHKMYWEPLSRYLS